MSGWIKLHKSLKEWQWYDDHNATRLLVHLLLSVNYEDKHWKGQVVKAGTYITSWENLSKEIGFSVKQTRVAMDKLERSKEVARYTTNKWQAITLIKWDKLQVECTKEGKQIGRQRATTKEDKEIKNITIPEFSEFLEYAVLNKPNVNQQDLRLKYESWKESNWSTNKNGKLHPILNWKTTLLNTLPYIKEVVINVQRQIID